MYIINKKKNGAGTSRVAATTASSESERTNERVRAVVVWQLVRSIVEENLGRKGIMIIIEKRIIFF